MARELVLIPRVKYESLIRQLENDKSIDSEFKVCKKNINNDMQDMTDNVTNNVTSDHSSLKLINQFAPAHLEPKQSTNIDNVIRSNIEVAKRMGPKIKRKYVKNAANDPLSVEVKNQDISSDRRPRTKIQKSELSRQSGGNMKRRRYVNQSFSAFMQNNKPNNHRWVPYKI